MQPAIERTDDVFQEVDYDVVSGSGLLGAAESLQGMSVHDRVPFLKVRSRRMSEHKNAILWNKLLLFCPLCGATYRVLKLLNESDVISNK